MNRTHKNTTSSSTATTQKMPQIVKRAPWWNEGNERSWQEAKGELIADWHKVADRAHALEAEVADKALAFGHQARDRFTSLSVWTDEVEGKLAADWSKFAGEAGEGWSKVVHAVKHGWESARRSFKS